MIGFVLLTILLVAAWVLFGHGVKHDEEWEAIVGVIFGLVFTGMFLASVIYFATRSSDAADFKKERDYRQELVLAISDEMSPTTTAKIIYSAEKTNARIEANRKHCDSEMWGFMYNKEIAEVEPIVIPEYEISIRVKE